MDIFNRLSKPPESALKTIQAGRLKGKSDINPQWRYRAITDEFGLCGVGWKYTIDKLWIEKGAYDTLGFAQVSVYIKLDDVWSEPIPGIGGHKLSIKESSGMYDNDEVFKMAVTDALSVALKMIGVASEIYEGNWDGSKYKEPQKQEPQKPTLAYIKNIIDNFAKLSIYQEELETKLSKKSIEWDNHDIQILSLMFNEAKKKENK